jgi:hypothetical protein
VPGSTRGAATWVSDVSLGSRPARRASVRSAAIDVSGIALIEIGLAIPPLRTLTAAVILVEAR